MGLEAALVWNIIDINAKIISKELVLFGTGVTFSRLSFSFIQIGLNMSKLQKNIKILKDLSKID